MKKAGNFFREYEQEESVFGVVYDNIVNYELFCK